MLSRTNRVIVVGDLNPGNRFGKCTRQQNFVISDAGISMSITAKHEMHPFKIMEKKPINTTKDGLAPTLCAGTYVKHNAKHITNPKGGHKECAVSVGKRIRRLTPRELFRLMGVRDAQIDTLQASGLSRTRQTQLAGNSIVVDVLYHIFDRMFVHTEPVELTLF